MTTSTRDERQRNLAQVTARVGVDGCPALAFGGDYNPEQWPREVWREDVALMREANVNMVSVGIFSWALIEREEGVYTFDWLDRVLDLLHENGIFVDLADATASPPPWFSHRYPESLPVSADGVRLGYGSRQAFCASNADYRRAAASLTRAIVERYAEHPAVVMWHVHNEYGCHNQPCYCDASAEAFRRWLRERYQTVDALNAAWATAFWSQHYTDWAQITPPRRSGAQLNPTQQLDFARFSSDELLECCRAEVAIIHELASQPVTTNFMGFSMGLTQPVDYWRWADELDLISNDHYLAAEDERNFQELAMTADLTRGWAGGEPWLLMEHSTSAVNWQSRNLAKAPGELLRNSLQHAARGADGILFFQWRQSVAGAEKFHSALVPHAGTDSAVWREAVELGHALQAIREVVGSRVVDARVAILHDTDARWASEIDSHPSVDASSQAETRRWHDAFYRLGLSTDIRRSTDELGGYALVIVPMQYLVTDAAAERLRTYVEGGGHVVITYFSGIVDENDRVRTGGYPGAFRDLLGVRMEQFAPLRAGGTVALSDGAAGMRNGATGIIWSEQGRSTGAQVLATFTSGVAAGSPAITRNDVGDGRAYYVATALQHPHLTELAASIAREAGLEPLELPDGVEVTRRGDGERTWTFVINHSDQTVELPIAGVDLLGAADAGAAESVRVAQGGVAVVRSS